MKILLIFTFFLISGLVVCFDVIGYSRGSVIINCNYHQDKANDKYFCKESTNQCVYLESDQRQNSWDHEDRVSRNNFPGGLMVIFRDLSLEDAGSYQCGGPGVWSHTVNLRVKTDPCCLEPKTVIGYLGETVTISCSYPEEFQRDYKLLYKLDGQTLTPLIDTYQSQKDRFSISDNRSSRVVSVRISDVTEDDGGVYYCSVGGGGIEVGYYSLFSEIHLQVSDKKTSTTPKQTTPPARPSPTERPISFKTGKTPKITYNSESSPPGTTSSDANGSSSRTPSATSTAPPAPKVITSGNTVFIIIIIITVSICVVLLLIGGLTLICKLRCSKTQGSNSSNMANMGVNNQVSHSASDYEEIRDIRPHLDTQTTPLYSTLQPPTNPLNTVYVLAQRPSPSPAQGIYSMVQLPQPSPEAQGYSTVSFLKNPDSDTDASVAL